MGLFKFCITYHPDSKNGGGERARTVDPLRARQVLSQLSYTPMKSLSISAFFCGQLCGIYLVGLDRFELSTSRLSGVRSNQLSYRPARLAAGENKNE